MPDIAVLETRIVTVHDIYKFNIDKESNFLCFHCDNPVRFRQSRNGDNTNYSDHFYHPNNVKDTHIECDKSTLDRVRDNDSWHNTLSSFVKSKNREVVRKNNSVKHIVDGYDHITNTGIEFQNSPISVEDVQSRDAITHLNWIFNIEKQYTRAVHVGNIVVCEIPHENWEKAVKAVKNKIYLFTGRKEWIYLEDRESYRVEIDKKTRNVWIGKPCSFEHVYNETCLNSILTKDGLVHFQGITNELEKTFIMYARCKKSMVLLDDVHRLYVNNHQFKLGEIFAIKSVAGSGKTTTLLELSKIHTNKKILYLAFNKALITDIRDKINKQGIKNLYPCTFHALVREVYISIKKKDPNIIELRPQNIHNTMEWFKDKPFSIKKYYVNLYNKFCKDPYTKTPQEYSEKPLLHSLWNKTVLNQLITFDSLVKLCLINNWMKDYIDATYDMIMIDETQDFDSMMLNMLLNDTTVPKIFVGDPRQSIYQWRGCINGFDHLPPSTITIEFYSTFRIGDPACEIIRKKFDDCWMISKSPYTTVFTNDIDNYTYLFRSWRHLLKIAQTLKHIWICNYEEQVEKMRNLHKLLSTCGAKIQDQEFSDDLPKFLRSINKDALEQIICTIQENVTSKQEAKVKLYTIHAYKGLEDDNIRIANDNPGKNGSTDEGKNLYYVALTRGMKSIMEDT